MAFAQNRHAHLTDGHVFDHIFRVYKLAEHILADYPQANRDLVLTAALLHDTYDDKLFEDVVVAKQEVIDFLTTLELPYIDQVFEIIGNLSFSANLDGTAQALDINGQIVQDADR
ncbi:MAG: HD domain-containing protein, partial [Pseudolactococcus laudensis]